MYISSNKKNITKMNYKNEEQKNDNREVIKEFKKRKIKDIEQDKEAICTIRKESNHISNQGLSTPKERRKILLKQRCSD